MIRRLVQAQPACHPVPAECVAMAGNLLAAGWRPHSSLWVAIKFLGVQNKTPTVPLMSYAARIDPEALIRHEAEDLARVSWEIAPFAKGTAAHWDPQPF